MSSGVLVIDKPLGPTSFDLVQRVRRGLLRLGVPRLKLASGAGELGSTAPIAGGSGNPLRVPRLKVGHGGTLDPMASGVLPICIGEATKLAPFLLDADKEYEAEVRFGAETDTLDAAGKVIATGPIGGLDAAAVAAALGAFRGEIEQVPPMYSALKRGGRPLYDYARAGEEVERAPRRVVVHALDLLGFDAPDRARLRVRCSKGTYVRVLAADLGRALGSGAHLAGLRRTASGPFGLEQALTPDAFERLVAAGGPLPLVPLAEALGHLRAVTVGGALADDVRRGRKVPWAALGAPGEGAGGRLRLLEREGALVAVVEPGPDGTLSILRVFADENSTENCGSAVD